MAEQTYTYSKLYVIWTAVLLCVIPVLAITVCIINFDFGSNIEENLLIFTVSIPIIILASSPIVWAVITLSTTIEASDNGIAINKINKKINLSWDDIISVRKIAVFSSTFPSFGPPRDLELTITGNKKITVHYFLTNGNDDNYCIEVLESLMSSHISKRPQT
jgi:hypothetical protein